MTEIRRAEKAKKLFRGWRRARRQFRRDSSGGQAVLTATHDDRLLPVPTTQWGASSRWSSVRFILCQPDCCLDPNGAVYIIRTLFVPFLVCLFWFGPLPCLFHASSLRVNNADWHFFRGNDVYCKHDSIFDRLPPRVRYASHQEITAHVFAHRQFLSFLKKGWILIFFRNLFTFGFFYRWHFWFSCAWHFFFVGGYIVDAFTLRDPKNAHFAWCASERYCPWIHHNHFLSELETNLLPSFKRYNSQSPCYLAGHTRSLIE